MLVAGEWGTEAAEEPLMPGPDWYPDIPVGRPPGAPPPAPVDPLAPVRSALDAALVAINLQGGDVAKVKSAALRKRLATHRTDAYNAIQKARGVLPKAEE